MHPGRVYFYDFSDDFARGDTMEVAILHWYTSEGTPWAVVEVIDGLEGAFPLEGEIHRVKIGKKLFSQDEITYRNGLASE
jgi:hypothetical protein